MGKRMTEGRNKGFTLIELIIVVALIAMAMGITVSVRSNTATIQMRKQSTRLSASIRYAYNQAATLNTAFRIVFDLTEQAYWLEESTTDFLLQSDEKKKEEENKIKEDQTQTTTPAFGESKDKVFKKIKFKKKIKIRDIFVAHQEEPVDQGKAYLYFFPTGLTESAMIHLSNAEEDYNFTILVNPITGHSKIKNEYIDYKDIYEK